jgi:hypothetical protein
MNTPTPKIIQLLMSHNDSVWQGVLLGLGNDGMTYHCQGDTWQPYIPPLEPQDKATELTAVTEQRDEAWKEIDLLKTNLRIQTEHTENAVQDRADEHIELHNQIHELTEQLDLIEGMYQKVIAAVLDCDPIPACKRENDQLEPPWEVITRIREQRDRLQLVVDEGCRASSLCREYREQRDKLAEALKMIATFDYDDLQCDNGHGARYVATEALQSLTTNAKP